MQFARTQRPATEFSPPATVADGQVHYPAPLEVCIWKCRPYKKTTFPITLNSLQENDLPQSVLAVVSVLGKDQKGVVAQFATYMAERGINIEDIEQRVVRGFFVMDMLVDLKDLTCDLSEIITGILDLGRKIDMEVRVHLHSEKRAKR